MVNRRSVSFNFSSVNVTAGEVTIGFTGGNWITPFNSGWSLLTRLHLTKRNDTEANSMPADLVPSQYQSFIFKKDATTPYLLLLVILMMTLFAVDRLVVQNVEASCTITYTGPIVELAIKLLL